RRLGLPLVLAAFTVVFGARPPSARGAQEGLLVAIALESLVKLVALAVVGAAAVVALGGVAGMQAWLAEHPEATRTLHTPLQTGGVWASLVVVAFASSFLLPRPVHVPFGAGATGRG